jgi:hypothetical protein
VSADPETDKDLSLHVVTVLQIRMLRQLRCGQESKRSSTAINRRPHCLLLEPSRNTMAKPLDNYAMPWSCVRPPEHSARVSSLGARRMLANMGELHQSLFPRSARNPGAAWGNTCLDRPCDQGPNVVLETTMLHQEARVEVVVWQPRPQRRWRSPSRS